MSSTEPPDGSTPPPGEPTPPPPPEMPANPATVPPPDQSMAPPPPPPPPAGATPGMGAPGVAGAAYGPGQPGSLVDRFLARLIDGLIVGIPSVILQFIFQAAVGYWAGLFLGGVITAILGVGYFGYLESNRGQTIGKQVMKLKTLGPDGHSNPTMNEAIKRNIYYVFGIVPCLGTIAAIASIIVIAVNINSDPQRQHWFDRFAGGTRVVKVG